MQRIAETDQVALIRLAIQQADIAAKRGDSPFGGVLVDYRGEVVLALSNTTFSSGTDNFLSHVEFNIIRQMAEQFQLQRLDNFSIFLNAASCPVCAIAMIDRGIRDFYYGAEQETHTYPRLTMQEIASKVPYKINITGGILEKECRQQIIQGRKLRLAHQMSN